jgi:hypothetical protein
MRNWFQSLLFQMQLVPLRLGPVRVHHQREVHHHHGGVPRQPQGDGRRVQRRAGRGGGRGAGLRPRRGGHACQVNGRSLNYFFMIDSRSLHLFTMFFLYKNNRRTFVCAGTWRASQRTLTTLHAHTHTRSSFAKRVSVPTLSPTSLFQLASLPPFVYYHSAREK